MIRVKVYKSNEGKIQGFKCFGHAGYAYAGEDIVCAAVSMLVINTINSIEKFLPEEHFTVKTDEESGLIDFKFSNDPSEKAELLLNSMVLGVQTVEKNYESKYVKLEF
jgi:uncharacterized protein YsxB (DUF464 family)